MTDAQQNVLDGFLAHIEDPCEVTDLSQDAGAGRIVRIDVTRPWGSHQTAIISPAGRLDWTTPVAG